MEPSEQEHTGAGQWAPRCRSRARATCRVGLAHPSGTPQLGPTHEGPLPPSHAAPITKHQCLFPEFTERQTTFREATLDRQPCFSFSRPVSGACLRPRLEQSNVAGSFSLRPG